MPGWSLWLDSLQSAMHWLSINLGLSEAAAIIVLTLLVRLAWMPISLTAAWRMQRNKLAMERLKPALETLRTELKDQPAELAQRTMALYREHGISLFDRLSLVNAASQAVFGLGLYQSLQRLGFSSKFLWIANIGRPDAWLTALVVLLMLLSMALMPGATADSQALTMMVVATLISAVMVATLPSALGIYWASSNAVSLCQALALRMMLALRPPLAARQR